MKQRIFLNQEVTKPTTALTRGRLGWNRLMAAGNPPALRGYAASRLTIKSAHCGDHPVRLERHQCAGLIVVTVTTCQIQGRVSPSLFRPVDEPRAAFGKDSGRDRFSNLCNPYSKPNLSQVDLQPFYTNRVFLWPRVSREILPFAEYMHSSMYPASFLPSSPHGILATPVP